MRLCRALDRGKANGVYIVQPGSTLRAPWRKHKHPLDVLQSSLDLAAAKDPYTQARFQNIPSSGQANRSIVGDITIGKIIEEVTIPQWKQTLPYIPYQE